MNCCYLYRVVFRLAGLQFVYIRLVNEWQDRWFPKIKYQRQKRSFTLTFRRILPYLSMGMSGIKITPNKPVILNGRQYRLTTYRNKEIYQRIINIRPLRMEFIAFAIPRLYAISAAWISHAAIFNFLNLTYRLCWERLLPYSWRSMLTKILLCERWLSAIKRQTAVSG